MEFLSRYSKVLIAVLALGLPLSSVYFHGKSASPTFVDHYLNAVTSPALFVVDGVVGGVYGIWGQYIALVNLQAENDELARENKRLLGESKKARRALEAGSQSPAAARDSARQQERRLAWRGVMAGGCLHGRAPFRWLMAASHAPCTKYT